MFGLLPPVAAQAAAPGPRTFKVTAYYSPLPNQSFYLKGNFEAEIRLNGEGKHGASGRAVFPGMIAAPKTYSFGTKIRLDGLGVGTVTDRGGAIVHAGERNQSHDRIDVWMGYGEPGLRRALKWGVRVVDGDILSDANTPDTIYYDSMDPDIKVMTPQERVKEAVSKDETKKIIAEVEAIIEQDELMNSFPGNMGKGAEGIPVKIIQSALKQLGYYKLGLSGTYDQDTVNAVLRFQIDKKLISGLEDNAAGYFGAQTRLSLVQQLKALNITMDVLENEALLEDMRGTEIRNEEQYLNELVFQKMPKSQMDMYAESGIIATNNAPKVQPVVANSSAKLSAAKVETTLTTKPKVTLSEKDIILLKRQLRSLGFYSSATTGVWTSDLTQGVKMLQIQGGLTQRDGSFSSETRTYLGSLWSEHVVRWGFTSTLDLGDSGTQVTKLQTLLKRHGFYEGAAGVSYDQATKDAVLAFQVEFGIVADTNIYGAGMVGPKTVQALNSVLFQLQ